jgi:hypothetical protein
MINRIICLSFMVLFICSVSALTFDWGMKYGAGVGSAYGSEINYKLQYDFYVLSLDNSTTPLGHYLVQSKHGSIGVAQNAGLYFTFPLHQDITDISLQTELIWQRYNYKYSFDKAVPQITDSLLAGLFNHNLNGEIDTQIDYITIPVLFMLHQGIKRDPELNKTRVGVFTYAGPSFSVLINHENTPQNGVVDLNNSVADFIYTSQNDTDAIHSFICKKKTSATDKMVDLKYGFVIGMGWNLQDLMQWGIGKDEWVIDTRFEFNINELGDAMSKTNFKLYSAIVSLGYKF